MKVAAAAVGGFGVSLFSGCAASDPDLADYCAYSAASERELRDCLRHIDAGESTLAGHGSAAKYARGDLAACRRDAGPFCGDQEAVNKACRDLDRRRGRPEACRP